VWSPPLLPTAMDRSIGRMLTCAKTSHRSFRRAASAGGSCTHGNAHDLHFYDGHQVIDGHFAVS
jgi:hypothetical protein